MIAAFVLISFVIAGTALASFSTNQRAGSGYSHLTKPTNEPIVVITPLPATTLVDSAIPVNNAILADDIDKDKDGKYKEKFKEHKNDHKEKGHGNPHRENNKD